MRLLVGLLGLVLIGIGGSASARVPLKAYSGADAGHLVVGVGLEAVPSTTATLRFRRLGDQDGDILFAGPALLPRAGESGNEWEPQTAVVIRRAGLEAAFGVHNIAVLVVDLPPGRYEIYQVDLHGITYPMIYRQSFAGRPLPFEIRAGRSTYLGRLSFVGITSRTGLFGLSVFNRWVRVLTDEAEQDLAVAARHNAKLEPIDHAEVLDEIDRLSGADTSDVSGSAEGAAAARKGDEGPATAAQR